MCVEGKHAVQGTFALKTGIVVFSNLLVLANVVHVKPYQTKLTHGDPKSKSTKIICNARIVPSKNLFLVLYPNTEVIIFFTKVRI